MKMSTVRVGAGASIGDRAILLYDSQVGIDAALEPLSLVMKGEQLPRQTRWRGIPAQGVVIPDGSVEEAPTQGTPIRATRAPATSNFPSSTLSAVRGRPRFKGRRAARHRVAAGLTAGAR
jgi:hypothetical protein